MKAQFLLKTNPFPNPKAHKTWSLRSEYVSGSILLLLFGVISFFVVTTNGFWMRLLYAVAWGSIILFVVWNAKYSRSKGIEAARPE